MRLRNLLVAGAACTIAMVSAGPSWAQARVPAKTDDTNPRTARFGVWDNSTNPNNVMTYEAYEKDGSKLTVSCTYENHTGHPVSFGERTEDEMCFNFMMVYPIDAIPAGVPRYCSDS